MLLLEIVAMLASLLGTGGMIFSANFRATVAAIAAGIFDNVMYVADMIRRVAVVALVATFLAIDVMYPFGIWTSLMLILVIFAILFYISGRTSLERARTLLLVAAGTWGTSLLFARWGNPELAMILAIVAVLALLFLIVLASQIERFIGTAITSFLGLWAVALITVVMLYQLHHTADIYTTPVLLVAVLLLTGILGMVKPFLGKFRAVITVGQIAALLLLTLPVLQYVPGPWQSVAHYAMLREHAYSTARVKEIAATGKNYYVLPETTIVYRCVSCKLIAGDSTKKDLKDSLVVEKTTMEKLSAGQRLVSYAWRPVMINEKMFIGVHPKFDPKDGIGYDVSKVYLVETDRLPAGMVEEDLHLKQSYASNSVIVPTTTPVAPSRSPQTTTSSTITKIVYVPTPVANVLVATAPEPQIEQRYQEGNFLFELRGCTAQLVATVCKIYVTNSGNSTQLQIESSESATATQTVAVTMQGEKLATTDLSTYEIRQQERAEIEIDFPAVPASANRFRVLQIAARHKEWIGPNFWTSNPVNTTFTDVEIHR